MGFGVSGTSIFFRNSSTTSVPENHGEPSTKNMVAAFAAVEGKFRRYFRKAKANAIIENLHFYDTQHEAITKLAKRFDVPELARSIAS
ncbi:MAG: hypothetical protein ACHQ1H_12180 [Nitrososphaerales archaeon]